MSLLKKIGGAIGGAFRGLATGGITGGIAGLIGGIKDQSTTSGSKLSSAQTNYLSTGSLFGDGGIFGRKKTVAPAPVIGGSLSSRDPQYTSGGSLLGSAANLLTNTGGILGGAVLGGATGAVVGGAAAAGGGLADQVLAAAAGPGGLTMATLISGTGAPASASSMSGLMAMGGVLWDAAKKVIEWALAKMDAIQKQLAKTGMLAWGLIKKLEGEIWDFLKSILPYAGIAAVVAGVGLGIFFGWSTMKRWAKALWNKLMGKKKRRRRGITARELATTRRVGKALKKAYMRLPKR